MKLKASSMHVILRWARRHPTIEVTGFVSRGPGGELVVPMRNVSKQPDKFYAWSVVEMAEQYLAMDTRGHEPVLIYHSHPLGRREPSDTDMQGALQPGLHYGIAYPGSERWELSVWECLEQGVLVEAPLDLL